MSALEPRISWVLKRAATEFADAEGTVDLATGERRSWAETSRRVGGVATGLRDMGLDPGDRVGVLALNSARHFELWFAIPNFLSLDTHRRGAAGEELWATRLQSAGSPVVGVRVEVRRDDGSVCEPGEPGEIYIQGPNTLIAGFKVPRSINLRTHEEPLPKSGAGKILKRDLRAPFWEGHNRSIN